MADYVLSCCSTADLPAEYFTERNVAYTCFHYNMDGKEYPDDHVKSMPFDEFYRRIAAGAGVPVQEVNKMLKQFEQTQTMMKSMQKGGLAKMMRALGGLNKFGGGLGGLGGFGNFGRH